MKSHDAQRQFRRTVLESAFGLLYGPFVLLHEVVGRTAFGPAWAGRRLGILISLSSGQRIIDVGAGAGHLAHAAAKTGILVTGVDPSMSMRAAAARAGATVLAGRSWNLPFPDGSCDVIVASYPGPWIFEPATAEEFRRVLTVDGSIIVLLGGAVSRGPWSTVRRLLLSAAYGSGAGQTPPQPDVPAAIGGRLVAREDRWGTAYLWIGYPRHGKRDQV